MSPSLRPFARSRRLLALGLLAWLMLVVGTVHAAAPAGSTPMHPGMLATHGGCADDLSTRTDLPDCCRHGAAGFHCDCPPMSLPVFVSPPPLSVGTGIAVMPVPERLFASILPDRPDGPPPRPPRA